MHGSYYLMMLWLFLYHSNLLDKSHHLEGHQKPAQDWYVSEKTSKYIDPLCHHGLDLGTHSKYHQRPHGIS